MYLPEHGSPVETSPSESVRECLAFSLLAPSSWRPKCPVPAERLSWEGGTRRGPCSALALHSQIDQEPGEAAGPSRGREEVFISNVSFNQGPSVLCCFHPTLSSLKPTGARQKWGFRNLTQNGLELGLV